MKLFTRDTVGYKLEKHDFFRVFNVAWDKSVITANAQGAFRGTGVFPFDITAIRELAYEPSITTERQVQEFPPSESVSPVPIRQIPSPPPPIVALLEKVASFSVELIMSPPEAVPPPLGTVLPGSNQIPSPIEKIEAPLEQVPSPLEELTMSPLEAVSSSSEPVSSLQM